MEETSKYFLAYTCLANVSFHLKTCLYLYNFIGYAELAQLTGLAAILRFPMPELEEDEDYEEESEAAGGESNPGSSQKSD